MRKVWKFTVAALAIGAVALGATAPASAGPWRGGWRHGWVAGRWHGGWWGWRAHYWGGFYWGHAPWYWGPYWAPPYPPPPYWGYYQVPPPPAPPPQFTPAPSQAEAPPPPAAARTRSFIVYFPFDKSTLTAEAQTVVNDAAAYAKSGHATSIKVVGYTDSSGSVGYNEALSKQRATVMADALTRLGIAPSMMDVSWQGKRNLAVPTADGVREPLNRRSTIEVDF